MLGEVDRARGIYLHCSQFSDPRVAKDFWEVWRSFEVQHGNEDTFREMLRVKRSVEAQYTQPHFNAENIMADTTVGDKDTLDPMQAAEAQLTAEERKRKERSGEVADAESKRRKLMEELGTTGKERMAKFEEAEAFAGPKAGYIFKLGSQGLGYYEDLTEKQVREREQEQGLAPSGPPGLAAVSSTAPAAAANPEEIDLDIDLEEAPIPAEVFSGSAGGSSVLTKEKERLDEQAKNEPP